MNRILKFLATIVMLSAMVFLGGEWPEGTTRKEVVTYDGAAFAVFAVCAIYLNRAYKSEGGEGR